MFSRNGMPTSPAKLAIVFTLLLGWMVVLLFSWVPITSKYPAYAADSATAPAYWTGVFGGLGPILIYLAMTKL